MRWRPEESSSGSTTAAHHRSASRAVGVLDAVSPDDQAAAGEVGALDAGHRGLESSSLVASGWVSAHWTASLTSRRLWVGMLVASAHRDARGPVHEESEPHTAAPSVRSRGCRSCSEVDGVLSTSRTTPTASGAILHSVAHGGGLVAALGTEVALPRDEGMPHRPPAAPGAPGRAVDGAVAVGVAESITSPTTREHCSSSWSGRYPSHIAQQDAAVHGFEAVAHVRGGRPHDHGGVVEVGLWTSTWHDWGGVPPHLLLEGPAPRPRAVADASGRLVSSATGNQLLAFRSRGSDVQEPDVAGVVLDEAALLFRRPHPSGRRTSGRRRVLQVDPQQDALGRVHGGLPQILRVHLTEPLVTPGSLTLGSSRRRTARRVAHRRASSV